MGNDGVTNAVRMIWRPGLSGTAKTTIEMIQHEKRGEVLQARGPDGAAHAHPGTLFFLDCEDYLSNLSG
jgi:hypothetical protein